MVNRLEVHIGDWVKFTYSTSQKYSKDNKVYIGEVLDVCKDGSLLMSTGLIIKERNILEVRRLPLAREIAENSNFKPHNPYINFKDEDDE